ncbi:MAG: hypothetical protein KKF77_00960 [Proteobacteria bacterium]|nr:hypothetical protein [Pseudomonadota bacterium]
MVETEYTGYSRQFEAGLQEFLKHTVAMADEIATVDGDKADILNNHVKNIGLTLSRIANAKTKTSAAQLRFIVFRDIADCGIIIGEAARSEIITETKYITWIQTTSALSACETIFSIPGIVPLAKLASLFVKK